MATPQYQAKDRDMVLDLLNQADLTPTTLTRNEDNSFVASFDAIPIPTLRAKVETIAENVVILEPEALPEIRQPNQDPQLASVVRFAFVD